jgi:oxygen-independent coproporphyrinogen-3 oxidase
MILVNVNDSVYYDEVRVLTKAFHPYEKVECRADEEDTISKIITVTIDGLNITVDIDGMVKSAVSDADSRKAMFDTLKTCLYLSLSQNTNKLLPWGMLTGVRPTKIVMSLLDEGKSDEEIIALMKDHYKVSDLKTKLSLEVAKREKRLLSGLDYENGISLYVGIPFCPTTCLYCSFTSYPIGIWGSRTDSYVDALIKEMEYVSNAVSGRKLDTIYFGGGTPTTLSPAQLDRVLTRLEEGFDLSRLKELTVEAGRPDSVTREKLYVLRKHNVSRISINPQTMNQKTLDLIGRRHTVLQVIDAFKLARECGFDNINMDLIVGLPGETMEDVRHTMEEVKKLSPDNLTVHSLAIKRAAALNYQKAKFTDKIMNTDEIINMTAGYAKDMGLNPYYLYRQKNMAGNFENVGYAKEGYEGLYNILIMEERQSIIALGAGASSKFVFPKENRIERAENVKDVKSYIERIDEMIDRKRAYLEN